MINYRSALVMGLVLTGVMSSCAPQGTPVRNRYGFSSTNAATNNPQNIEAFRTTVYQVTRANCAGCHGTVQSPLHASANVEQAYNAAIGFVNFNDPAASTLVARSSNGHCGTAACSLSPAVMTNAIQSWKGLLLQ